MLGKLFWRRPVKTVGEIQELSDLLTSLQEEPTLQVAVIENSIRRIARSEDYGMLERVVDILAKNNAYRGLHSLLVSSVDSPLTLESLARYKSIFFDIYKSRLTPEQKIRFADYSLEIDSGSMGFGLRGLVLLDGLEGIQDRIKAIVTNPKFYESYPVTAVIKAIQTENYEAVGLTFAHLRKAAAYELSSKENEEISKLRRTIMRPDEMEKGRIMSEVRQQVESLGRVVLEHYSPSMQKIYAGLNDLLAGMREPQKAFEAVGDAFLTKIQREGSAAPDDIYGLAVEYFVLSGNKDKLMQASKVANQVKDELPRAYSTSIAAFRGFKALLTKFTIDDTVRQEVLAGLKETFRPFWIYANFPQGAIEAAELTGDFTALQDNFYQSLEKNVLHNAVYHALRRNNAVDDARIIQIAEDYLRAHQLTPQCDGQLKRVMNFADIGLDRRIDPTLIINAIQQVGLKSKDAIAGFDYLEQRGLLTPAQENVYELALASQRKS